MNEQELSTVDFNRIGMKCIAAWIVPFCCSMAYFYYVMSTSPLSITAWTTFVWIVLFIAYLPFVPFLICFEIVYHKEAKKPVMFHLKRLLIVLLLFLFALLGWALVNVLLNWKLSTYIGYRFSILASSYYGLELSSSSFTGPETSLKD
jgi:hypothetical protein